jgi:predicted P-loop ATPase
VSAAVVHIFEQQLRRNPQGGAVNSYRNCALIVRGLWGSRLRYNTMREVPELDRKPYEKPQILRVREEIEARFAICPKTEDVTGAMLEVADEQRYHPVQEYLRKLPPWDRIPRLRRIPSQLFGLSIPDSDALSEVPPIACAMLERWFVAAIARAFEPGCQVDNVLILQGDQGTRKTTFFRELGGAWGAEGDVEISERGVFNMAGKWIWCWDELSGLLQTSRTRGYAAINGFITRTCDTFRPPYRPAPIDHPRTTILCGTANPKELIDDPTGDRRWWIIPVERRMQEGEVAARRDLFWAEALALYERGLASSRGKPQWWLTELEEQQRQVHIEVFRAIGGWDEPIAAWLAGSEASRIVATQGFVTVGDVLGHLAVPAERRRDRAVSTEAGMSVRRAGWAPVDPRPRLHGVRVTAYTPPNLAVVLAAKAQIDAGPR